MLKIEWVDLNMQTMLTYQTKPNLAKQAYWPNTPNPTHQIKPRLLVEAVDAWVRSAFGNVLKWESDDPCFPHLIVQQRHLFGF